MRAVLMGIAMGLACPALANAAAQPPSVAAPAPLTGRATVDGIGQVAWELHYDRNALRDSRHVVGGWIALTQAGSLLLFDEDLRHIRREYFGPVAVTCLAVDDAGAVFAGFEDGHIVAVEGTSLALTEVAAVPGAIVWMGYRRGGWVVVHEISPQPDERQGWGPELSVTDLGTKKTHRLEKLYPHTYLLDRQGRLWLGEDHGEWGGGVTVLDLGSGKLRKVTPSDSDGVYGLAELGDGQVWAFGGTLHMGLRQCHITRVDGAKPKQLFGADNLKDRNEQKPNAPPGTPRLPITHIVDDGQAELVVLSYSDVFRVDRALRRWRHVATVDLRYVPGRPDAVGSYPAVQRAVVLDHERLLLVTGGDGHVIVEDGTATPLGLPGQLGMGTQDELLESPIGPVMQSGGYQEGAWRLVDGLWTTDGTVPPMRQPPANGVRRDDHDTWWRTHLLKSPSGSVFAISGTPQGPGARSVDRWDKGGFVPISVSLDTFYGDYCFFTPDGDLWLRDVLGAFKRLDGSTWKPVGVAEADRWTAKGPARRPMRSDFVGRLRALGSEGPPWLLYNRRGRDLRRFDPGKDKSTPKTARVELVWAGKSLEVLDALAEDDGTVLLATEPGLFRFDPRKSELYPSPLLPPGEPVRSLVRDGRGRLWLGGQGIKLVLPGKTTPTLVPGLPVGDHTKLKLLGSQAAHPDGVVVGLQRRGVLFVEVRK